MNAETEKIMIEYTKDGYECPIGEDGKPIKLSEENIQAQIENKLSVIGVIY